MAAPVLIPGYPTPQHANAAEAILDFFNPHPEVEAVLLVNSCARGKATRDSCLDIVVIVSPETLENQGESLNSQWDAFYTSEPVFKELHAIGVFSDVHLDIIDAVYEPSERNFTGGPDMFEVEIGNHLAYSYPLYENGPRYAQLKAQWLPYYEETLRTSRLAENYYFFINDIQHIPLYAPRGLDFQCFNRFYDAFRTFLQGLFISRRVYPIAYDKWIMEQIVDMLEMPELYKQLIDLMEMAKFDGKAIIQKSQQLKSLYETYIGIPTKPAA